MKESGIVVSAQKNFATIQIVRGEKCQGCTLCDDVGADKMQVQAMNRIGAGVGDWVEVEIEPGQVLGHSFLLFVMPILIMIVGYFIGSRLGDGSGEGYGILGSLAGVALSFLILKGLNGLWETKESAAHVVRFIEPQLLNCDVPTEIK